MDADLIEKIGGLALALGRLMASVPEDRRAEALAMVMKIIKSEAAHQ